MLALLSRIWPGRRPRDAGEQEWQKHLLRAERELGQYREHRQRLSSLTGGLLPADPSSGSGLDELRGQAAALRGKGDARAWRDLQVRVDGVAKDARAARLALSRQRDLCIRLEALPEERWISRQDLVRLAVRAPEEAERVLRLMEHRQATRAFATNSLLATLGLRLKTAEEWCAHTDPAARDRLNQGIALLQGRPFRAEFEAALQRHHEMDPLMREISASALVRTRENVVQAVAKATEASSALPRQLRKSSIIRRKLEMARGAPEPGKRPAPPDNATRGATDVAPKPATPPQKDPLSCESLEEMCCQVAQRMHARAEAVIDAVYGEGSLEKRLDFEPAESLSLRGAESLFMTLLVCADAWDVRKWLGLEGRRGVATLLDITRQLGQKGAPSPEGRDRAHRAAAVLLSRC